MDLADETLREQFSALERVMAMSRRFNRDNLPSKIEEVVPDSQDADIKQYFDECCNFIDEAKRSGGAVLVHCIVGKSRSVTVVVAYLMKKHGMSLSEALEHVKSKRPIASPNSGFISQLMEFEKYLLGEQSFYSSIQLQSQIILTNMI
ncbi:Dual specificity protein phosphatase 1 [Morus notabilis]|uniref:protein-tyrosine-phosphatase n=1 Tax=Morus notabilis TaxID=981085 RepID=W9SGM2_9ROSA|nr:Dual specificity protein phosphatase 1 [Morus notabilis]